VLKQGIYITRVYMELNIKCFLTAVLKEDKVLQCLDLRRKRVLDAGYSK
jgi:hypothetical protein